MAFLRRSTTSELPESQVEFREENTAKRWITLIIYILLALVVAFLVVLAGRWVYHKVHNTSGPNPAPVAPQGTNKGLSAPNSTNKSPSGSNSGNPSPGSSSSGNSSPNNSNNKNNSGGKTPQPAPSPGNLPNNGPGDVVALFLGSSAAAAGLHYIIRARRQNNFN